MENLQLYMLITIMMVIMPGTDTIMVVKNTLAHGAKGGQATTLGIASGLVVHTTAAILGLSAIVSSSQLLYEIIKYAGVAYLFYLGITSLVSAKNGFTTIFTATNEEVSVDRNLVHIKSAYKQGLFSNVLNPKSFIFYLTFLPQFVKPNENYFTQLLILASILIIFALVWFLLLSFILERAQDLLKNPALASTIQQALGLMLIVFAFKLVLEKL